MDKFLATASAICLNITDLRLLWDRDAVFVTKISVRGIWADLDVSYATVGDWSRWEVTTGDDLTITHRL